jgi:hypothetical protein
MNGDKLEIQKGTTLQNRHTEERVVVEQYEPRGFFRRAWFPYMALRGEDGVLDERWGWLSADDWVIVS